MVTHFLYNTATATINHLYFLIIVFCNMFRHHTHCEIRTALSGEGTAAEQCRTTQDRGRGKGGSFCACWVFLCICNPLNTDMDYRIFIVRAWCSACVHTLDVGFESHPKDYVPPILARARCLMPTFLLFSVGAESRTLDHFLLWISAAETSFTRPEPYRLRYQSNQIKSNMYTH